MTNPTHIKLLKRVLKSTMPDILSNYFQYKGGFETLDLKLLYKQEKKKEVYYQEIQRNLDNLEEVQKGLILNEFHKVDFLANNNNDGFAFLLRFVRERTNFDINSLDHLLSNYDKAFFILQSHYQEFCDSYAIRSLDEYHHSRYWTARKDYFDDSISLREEDLNFYLESLKQQVQNTFKQELRGEQCQCKMLEFEDKIYIFFDLQDYPQRIQTFNGENIEEKDLNPVFEIIFVIDREIKIVNIYADSYVKRNELHKIIGSVIFKQENVPLYCRDKDIFDPQLVLDQLRKNKRFFIEITHESRIKTIYINKLVLLNTLEDYSEITLDTKQTKGQKQYSDGRDMIFQMLSDQSNFRNPAKYKAKSVQFIAIVDDATPKLLTKKITINKKGLTNLGFEKIDEQIKNCFRQSGIMKIAD
jgi:hypothetical protein